MVSKRVWIGLFFVCVMGLLIAIFSIAFAQGVDEEPIYSDGAFLSNLKWSNDSTRLVFNSLGHTGRPRLTYDAENDNWVDYDVATQAFITQMTWPLQPELSTFELQEFEPAQWSENRNTFIYESPNEKYLIYGSGQDETKFPLLTFATRLESTTSPLMRMWDPFSGPFLFNVIWSADNSSAVTTSREAIQQWGVLTYITDYTSSLSDLTTVRLNQLDRDGVTFAGIEVFDMTANGEIVLMTVVEQATQANRLWLWDVLNPSNSQPVGTFQVDLYRASTSSITDG